MNVIVANELETVKVLAFRLNEKKMAVPVADISEVNRLARLTAVPKAPDCVLGVINYHGKTTPVLNLKKLLGFSPSELEAAPVWFASGQDGAFVCLAVDALLNFADLPADSLDKLPETAGGHETGHVKYYARIDGELVQVLDVSRVIGDRVREFLRETAEENRDEENRDQENRKNNKIRDEGQ